MAEAAVLTEDRLGGAPAAADGAVSRRTDDSPAAPAASTEIVRAAPPARRAWDVEADRAFFTARRNGLLALGASLWLAIGATIAAAGAFGMAEADPFALLGASVAVGVGLYAFLTVVLVLLLDHGLERKVTEIRRVARLGCERLRIDDGDVMRPAIRDVLTEWMHINFFVRRLRESSAVARWSFVAQGAATIALALLAAPFAPDHWAWAASVIGAPIALSAAHVALHLRLLRKRAHAATPKGFDPTEVLADRMAALLAEVKELRKPARRG